MFVHFLFIDDFSLSRVFPADPVFVRDNVLLART